MVDTKISAFTLGDPPQVTDELVAARAGTNVKLSVGEIFQTALSNINKVKVLYEEGVDYTTGLSTQLPLPFEVTAQENIEVYFSGLYQNTSEWTLITGGSPSVDFAPSTIPANVSKIEVVILNKT
jgi:hypothetical protein